MQPDASDMPGTSGDGSGTTATTAATTETVAGMVVEKPATAAEAAPVVNPAFEQLPPALYYQQLMQWSESVKGQQQAALPPILANGPRPEIDPENYQALLRRIEAMELELAARLCDDDPKNWWYSVASDDLGPLIEFGYEQGDNERRAVYRPAPDTYMWQLVTEYARENPDA